MTTPMPDPARPGPGRPVSQARAVVRPGAAGQHVRRRALQVERRRLRRWRRVYACGGLMVLAGVLFVAIVVLDALR